MTESRSNKKTAGLVLLVLGIVVLVLSLVADSIGMGGWPGLGSQQIAGAVGGALVAVVGLLMMARK